ncbi:unnamed protein product [Arctia plantaginis]|nr:unnamed protein product [Arctia plantaginis]
MGLLLVLGFRDIVSSLPSPTAADDDDDEDETTQQSHADADDDGRVYKNPRNSPSVVCPRDEEQATLLGQKCLRKCSSDEDCKSKKKKCLCDGACGMSCIKPGQWYFPKRYLSPLARTKPLMVKKRIYITKKPLSDYLV